VPVVASVDSRGHLAESSNYGQKSVQLAARGVDVKVAEPEMAYGTKSGTSFSAPRVANIAAKILALNPSLSVEQMVNIIRESVDVTEELKGRLTFGGIINERIALEKSVRTLPELNDRSPDWVNQKISSILNSEDPILKK
jgi:subtilisin family serine protease